MSLQNVRFDLVFSVTEMLKKEIAEKDTRYSELEKVVAEKDENMDRYKHSHNIYFS